MAEGSAAGGCRRGQYIKSRSRLSDSVPPHSAQAAYAIRPLTHLLQQLLAQLPRPLALRVLGSSRGSSCRRGRCGASSAAPHSGQVSRHLDLRHRLLRRRRRHHRLAASPSAPPASAWCCGTSGSRCTPGTGRAAPSCTIIGEPHFSHLMPVFDRLDRVALGVHVLGVLALRDSRCRPGTARAGPRGSPSACRTSRTCARSACAVTTGLPSAVEVHRRLAVRVAAAAEELARGGPSAGASACRRSGTCARSRPARAAPARPRPA